MQRRPGGDVLHRDTEVQGFIPARQEVPWNVAGPPRDPGRARCQCYSNFRDIAEIGPPVESGRGHLTLEWFRVEPSTRLLRIHPAECSTALEDSAAEQRHPRDDEGASAAYRPGHRA